MEIKLNRSRNRPFIFVNTSLPKDLETKIDNELSFYITGYEHTDAFLAGTWDGKTRLLKHTKAGATYFPAGLLDRVAKIVVDEGHSISYTSQKRTQQKEHYNWKGPALRDYQETTKKIAMERLKRRRGALIVLPTGGGKTMCALKVVQEIGARTLVVVHTKELLKQWKDVTLEVLGEKVAMYGGGKKEPLGKITIGMIQTLSKDQAFDYDYFDMIILDECHHCPANTFYLAAMRCNAMYRIGLTATPNREDGQEMKFYGAIGEPIEKVTAKDLIDNGTLAKPTFRIVNGPPCKKENYRNFAVEYKTEIVQNRERNLLVAKEAFASGNKGLSTYVHVTQVAHGKILHQLIPGSEFISGSTKKDVREETIERFKNGKLVVLVSTLLAEGADIPGMNTFVNACGGKSHTALIQRVGRALRKAPGKDTATVIDFVDFSRRLYRHARERIDTYQEVYGQ